MKRNWKTGLLLTWMVWGVVSLAIAGEHPGTTTANPTSTAPLTAVQGAISDLDLQANSLKLTAQDGKVLMLELDPKATLVWKDNQMANLTDLKVGEQVKVRYLMMKEGKPMAKSVNIMQSPAAVGN